MKRDFGFAGILGSATAAVVMAALPAQASPTQITGVELSPTDSGLAVVLETNDGDRPQVFTVNRGNALVADIINTQLELPGGNGFLQNNPSPGIASVTVMQLDANSVRVVVAGAADPPSGQVATNADTITLNVLSAGDVAATAPTAPPVPPAAPSTATAASPLTTPATSEVLVPNPGVVIDGIQVQAPTTASSIPPVLAAPVPPPIGDIATSGINTAPTEIDLGTSEVVPRLVLRDAPVRDVLSLLARAAGLNVAYVGGAGTEEGADGETADTDVRISLDIENEPVQNVFNYVIRIAGLDVNRTGRTIFVGPRLPNSARNVITRTLRLNQVPVSSAVSFLVGLGAETAVTRDQLVTTVTAAPITTEEGLVAEDVQQTLTEQSQQTTVEVQRVDYQDSDPILRGLQVIGDERTNSVTIVGTPRAVEIAAAQLTQLDVRRRQAAINVRVIDVNLLGIDRASTSFSFGLDDTSVIVDGGVGIINFGSTSEADVPAPGVAAEGIARTVIPGTPGDFNFVNNFLAQLRLAVTSGNAKILTDPTLVVQEGQVAQVQLTQDVVTNFSIEEEGTGDSRRQTIEVERTPAGLILDVQIDRIDDNGFVSLSVAPAISAPSATQSFQVLGSNIQITLLSIRRLSSGQVRVRDGQTLVLSGIIQDQDRTTVSKVPILGDLPLLGSLFRSTERRNERQEVIVLLTPNIIDDSDTSSFGYRYTPTPETQQYIQDQGIQVP